MEQSNVRNMRPLRPAKWPNEVQDPEWTPTNGLDREVARARREMGPEKWAALNAEWL